MGLDVTSIEDILARIAEHDAPDIHNALQLPTEGYPWRGLSGGGKPHPLGSTRVRLWCNPRSNEWVATLDGVLRYISDGTATMLHDMCSMPALRARLATKFGLDIKLGTELGGVFYTESGKKVLVSTLRSTWVIFHNASNGVECAALASGAVFNAKNDALISSRPVEVRVVVPRGAVAILRSELTKLLTVHRAEARLLGNWQQVMEESEATVRTLMSSRELTGIGSALEFTTTLRGVLRRVFHIDTKYPLEIDVAVERIIKSVGKFETTPFLRRA